MLDEEPKFKARLATAVLVLLLVSTACGSRVPQSVLEAQDRALRSAESNNEVSQDGQLGLQTGEGGTVAAGQPTTAKASGAKTGTNTSGVDTKSCPSAPGVTPNSITVGSISTVSGPLPGATQGTTRGAISYFNYINAVEGGVHGRKIKVLAGDDALDARKARSEFLRIEPSVIAFVGGRSVADSGYVDLVQEKKVPYVGLGTAPEIRELPTYRQSQWGVPAGYINLSSYTYWRNAYPNYTRMGFLNTAVAGVRVNVPPSKYGFREAGFNIVYEDEAQATDPDYTPLVIRARQANIDVLMLYAFEINMHSRFIKSMKQQQWDPPLKLAIIAYNTKFYELVGGDGDGWHEQETFLPVLDPSEGLKSPGLARFLEWNKRIYPNDQVDQFPVGGWTNAEYFVEALKKGDPCIDRAKLLKALDSVNDIDYGGLLPMQSPGKREGKPCFVVVESKDGKWQREAPKEGGFHCPPPEIVKYPFAP